MRDNLKVETAGTGKVAAISLAIAQTLPFDRFELLRKSLKSCAVDYATFSGHHDSTRAGEL
jgi:hypothetical protein